MRIKNNLSPYPILNDYGDDYIDSSFTCNYVVDTRFSEVYGTLSFELNNKNLEQLIDEKKAEYAVHIECPSTCYRRSISSFDSEIEFSIAAQEVANTIEIRSFITLTEDIPDFCSEKFHPDYQGEKFSLKAHQIVAIGTAQNYNIQKDDTELDSLPSIFQIVKSKDKKKGALSVNTDNDGHIIVGLAEEVFDLYARLGKSTFRITAFSLVLLPALVIVLERMVLGKEDEAITSMHWYKVIEEMLNANGYEIEKLSIENDSLMTVCQAIFANPIARSFKELDERSERM